MDKNTTKVLFCYMFSLFCEKQENCKAISGHFHYVTTSTQVLDENIFGIWKTLEIQ